MVEYGLQMYSVRDLTEKDLRGALKKAQEDNASVTDDCSAVERLGMSVKIVEGEERNLKITTPLDLAVAKLFLEDTL